MTNLEKHKKQTKEDGFSDSILPFLCPHCGEENEIPTLEWKIMAETSKCAHCAETFMYKSNVIFSTWKSK